MTEFPYSSRSGARIDGGWCSRFREGEGEREAGAFGFTVVAERGNPLHFGDAT